MPVGDVETFLRAGKWFNRVTGEEFSSGPFPTRDQAVAAGRAESLRWGGDHIIRNQSGRIVERGSYGHGPHPLRG